MSSNMNPIQLMQYIRKSGNPQQFMINVMQEQSSNNPVITNLLSLAKANKTEDIENIARNLLKEQGKDFDKEFANFKQMFGL